MKGKIRYYCPLLKGKEISDAECCDVCLVSEEMMIESEIDQKYKEQKNFREICLKCKYHDQ